MAIGFGKKVDSSFGYSVRIAGGFFPLLSDVEWMVEELR